MKRILCWASIILVSFLAIWFVLDEFSLLHTKMQFHCYSVVNGVEQEDSYQIVVKGELKQKYKKKIDLRMDYPENFPFVWTNKGKSEYNFTGDSQYSDMMLAFLVTNKSSFEHPDTEIDFANAYCAVDVQKGYFYMLILATEYSVDYYEFYGSTEGDVSMETIKAYFAKEIEFFSRFR